MSVKKPLQQHGTHQWTITAEHELKERVGKAMRARGAKVFNDFGRQALINLCRLTEQELKRDNPEEYERIYLKETEL